MNAQRSGGIRATLAAQTMLLHTSRRPYVLLVAVTAILVLLELLARYGIFMLQPGTPQVASWPRVFGTFDLIGLTGLVWGFALWADEPPSRREHHWSLPPGIVRHSMARAAAGLLFLLLALAWLCALGITLAFASGGGQHIGGAPAGVWFSLVIQAVLPFMLGAVISTGAERPVAVLMWGVLLFLLFTLLGATVLPAAALPADFLIGRFGLFTTTKAGLRSAFGSQSGGMDWALRVVAPVAWFVLLALALAFAARFALWRYQRFPFHEQRLWPRRSA